MDPDGRNRTDTFCSQGKRAATTLHQKKISKPGDLPEPAAHYVENSK